MIRFRYGLAPKPSEEALALVRRGRGIWEARGPAHAADDVPARRPRSNDRSGPTCSTSSPSGPTSAFAWRPAGEAEDARREALQSARRGDRACSGRAPPSSGCARPRRSPRSAGSPATPRPSPSRPGSTATWVVPTSDPGDLAGAADEFQAALDLRPQDFWPNFYQGLCAYQLGRFDDAIDAFRVCIALAPETAECYYNRALAHEALGTRRLALRDYTHALQLDRTLSEAALNRGILLSAEGRHAEAAADFDLALATASGRETRGMIHYNRARGDLARGDRRGGAGTPGGSGGATGTRRPRTPSSGLRP